MENTVTAIEMRKKFGHILDRVFQKGEHITVLRGNKPLVTIVPAEEHQKQCRDHGHLKTIQEAVEELDNWKKKNHKKMKVLSQSNVVKRVRHMRDTRWSSTLQSS